MLLRIDQKLLILFCLSFYSSLQSAEGNELRKANMKVYCNEQVPYGKPTPIVISMKVLPVKTTITVSLSTPTYLLALFEVGKESGKVPAKWKRTPSISEELSVLGIRKRPDKWSYEEGFWTNLTGIFWTASDKFLTLVVRSEWLSRKQEVKEMVSIKVNLPPHCTPQLAIPECSHPLPPRKILITRGFHVRAIFLEKCNLTTERGVYNWSLSDAAGLTQFASYSTDGPLLKVQQYSWRFPASQELLRDFYLLQIEGMFEGSRSLARCYRKIEMGPVEAVISGGRQRRSSYKEVLWMNGSMSYDFSKRPSEKQFSTYLWDCESDDDKGNRFCRHNISSEAAFSIPANTLREGCAYVFRLQVSRDHNPKISSEMYQDVIIIARRVLQVKIECLQNCRRDLYIPNSPVHLMAECVNCGGVKEARRWSIDGQKMFSTKEITIHIGARTNRIQITLSMLAEDGRYGRDVKTLVRNSGPTGGECSVRPREGQEAVTTFVPCCQGFVTENQPIEYWYYAGEVLLDSCLDCSCGVLLPETNFLQVLACDALFACHTSWIKVRVDPLVGIPTQPTALQEYMNSPPNSIVKLLEEGLLSAYLQALNAIASHITLPESGITLLNGFRDIQPYTRSSLSKLANLTQTLAQRLPTSHPKTQALLIMLIRKLSDNFQEVISNEDATDMTQHPFMGTTLDCQKVYQLVQEIAKKIPRPSPFIYNRYQRAYLEGSLDQDLVDKLYLEMSTTRALPSNWLNITWETDRLRLLMKLFPSKHTALKKMLPPSKVETQLRCFKKQPKEALEVNTTDSLHRVILSKDLFKEIMLENDPNTCIKLISMQRTLNWWYPDEKRPTTRMLSVRVLRKKKDIMTTEVDLEEGELHYIANMTVPTMSASGKTLAMKAVNQNAPKEIHTGRYIEVIRQGRLRTLQSVSLYRIILDEQTVMAVHFIECSHKLQVKLKLSVKPIWSEISASKCAVPALATNKTILLRNNCRKPKRAYMALRVWSDIPIRNSPNTLLPDGPATFTFAFQIRSCATWIYSQPADKQAWSQVGCYPTMDISVAQELRCICSILSTYTSYVYYTPPIRVSVGLFTKPSINTVIMVVYLTLIAFLLLSIYWLFRFRNDLPAKTIFIRMADDDDVKDDELHDLLIKFHTGGRANSMTTSSVTLALLTTNQKKRKVRLPQDPEGSIFTRNSTINVWLRSREIRIPTKLFVYHDNAGRYPSWYLRRIEVNDIQTRETQVFIVKRWIIDKVLILQSPHIFQRGEILKLETWCKRFKYHFEMLCVNWALWQPVTGSWRENNHFDSISRAKRYCVFVSKIVIAYTCCAIYFQTTTIESLQLDREVFFSFQDLLTLVVVITATDVVFQVLFTLIAKHVS